jgi:curved DNA-binding protein CbpA
MSTVNLYDVLNVSQDCTEKEIKSSYRKLIKEFHPDKPSGDSEMFDLIVHAYKVLKKADSRKEYDNLHKLSKQAETDHFKLKGGAEDFLEAQEMSTVKKSKKEYEHDFKIASANMDIKHKMNRENEDFIPEKVATNRYQDLQLSRDQEDIENTHEQLFNDGQFNLAKFNAAWDESNKGPMEMIHHDGNPSAWNTLVGDANYSSIENYENLYVDSDENYGLDGEKYSNVRFDFTKKKKLTKEDITKLDQASYTDNHNTVESNYEDLLNQRMADRNLETDTYEDRDMTDFNTDPTCGGYSIFSNLGLDAGKNSIVWNNEDDIQKRYQKLLHHRNKKKE